MIVGDRYVDVSGNLWEIIREHEGGWVLGKPIDDIPITGTDRKLGPQWFDRTTGCWARDGKTEIDLLRRVKKQA
jgi:hypothetical protein